MLNVKKWNKNNIWQIVKKCKRLYYDPIKQDTYNKALPKLNEKSGRRNVLKL